MINCSIIRYNIRALILALVLVSLSQAAFLTYPFKANFDVRTARYTFGDLYTFSINTINNDAKPFDSLELRIYFRARDGLEKDLAVLLNNCIVLNPDGFRDTLFNQQLLTLLNNFPEKLENTFRTSDSTYNYLLRLPLTSIALKPLARLKLDIQFVKREQTFDKYEPIIPPAHQISNADWTLLIFQELTVWTSLISIMHFGHVQSIII